MITEIKTEKQLHDLEQAYFDALHYALDFINIPDGGASNFDDCVLMVKIPKRLRENSKLKLHKMEYGVFRGGYWFGNTPQVGQGERNTTLQEHICNRLIASGYNAVMHYQID